MKKSLLTFVFILTFVVAFPQNPSYDTLAIVILDHMSAIIGDINACHFKLNTETDMADPELGTMTSHEASDVWFSGPDKMLMESLGDKGHRAYWYNGKSLTWYSFTENNFIVIPAPSQTMAMIDSVNDTYGIDFPASDFFYPTFTDDLISHSDIITYQGKATVDGQSCFQIVARNKDVTVQLWISDKVMFLPVKMVMTYHEKSPYHRYEATFSDWQLNPGLPDAMFEFAIPAGAHEISILSRK